MKNPAKSNPSILEKSIIIVGGGPAGASTALHLCKLDPSLASDIIILERSKHPRTKVCSGALSHHGSLVLKGLGLEPTVPYVPLREIRMAYGKHFYSFKGNPIARVFQRSELDAWLIHEVRKKGVMVQENAAIRGAQPEENGVRVWTEQSTYRARMVVAADGAMSPLRHALNWPIRPENKSRLLDFPSPAETEIDLRTSVAILDFSRISHGLQGYRWDIPTQQNGIQYMDRGLFDSGTHVLRPLLGLKPELADYLAEKGIRLQSEEKRLRSHPYHFFDPSNEFARPHVLLAGDAAGVDPLCGEGIAFALAYGRVAARHIVDAFESQDFSGNRYKEQIISDPVTGQLSLRFRLARIAYSIESHALLSAGWSLASFIARYTKWNNPDYVPDA